MEYIQSFKFVGSPRYGISVNARANEYKLWWNGCVIDHALTLEVARHKMFARINEDLRKQLLFHRDQVRDLEVEKSKLNAGGLQLLEAL